MAGNYSHTTRSDGLTLTAAIYNADHQNHIDNMTPAGVDDYSSNATAMQSTTDPGEASSESLATSLAGELERLRFIIKELKGNPAQWYSSGWELGSGLLDVNGNELLKLAKVASAVNEVTLTNAATGNRPRVAASGETDVGLALRPKGTGAGASVIIEDGNGNEVLIGGVATASAVNEVTVTNAATGNPARIHASGETNVSLQLEPKGSGTLLLTDGTDTTKKVSLALSGITTATTRTITMPDRNIALGPTIGTEQASTSGTSIDFTSIPAGVRRITIMFDGVSTSGTDDILIQIGDSGGIENASYAGVGGSYTSAGQTVTASTAGFLIQTNDAADVLYGSVVLDLEDIANFTWVARGVLAETATASSKTVAGRKATSAVLDRVRITTTGGTDTFDLGAINISYE